MAPPVRCARGKSPHPRDGITQWQQKLERIFHKHLNRVNSEYREYCDVILSVEGVEFTAHKLILSLCSPYFETMFNGRFPESTKKTVELHGLEPDVFGIVLQYMYTGEIKMTKDVVMEVFKTADFLQLDWLKEQSCEYLRGMINTSNCISLLLLAELYLLEDIEREATNFAAINIEEVSKTPEFLALDFSYVTRLAAKDEVVLRKDESNYTTLMRWMRHNPPERKIYLGKLLKCITPRFLGQKFLQTVILKEKLLRESIEGSNWLLDNFSLVQNHQRYPYSKVSGDTVASSKIYNKHLFIMNSTNDFYSFHTTSKELTRLPNRPLSQGFATVAYMNAVYLFGGKRTRTAIKYNVLLGRWETIPFRCYFTSNAACAVNDCAYFTGGYSEGVWQSSVLRYDFIRDRMDKQPRMMMGRGCHGSVAHRNCVYACGGSNANSGTIVELSLSERMDVREGMWRLLPTMQHPHGNCTAAIVGDAVYCSNTFGGVTERFDVRRCNWEPIAPAPGEVGSIVACDDKLYRVYGGGVALYSEQSNSWHNIGNFSFESPQAVSLNIENIPNMEDTPPMKN